jgi:hypothetical protein
MDREVPLRGQVVFVAYEEANIFNYMVGGFTCVTGSAGS